MNSWGLAQTKDCNSEAYCVHINQQVSILKICLIQTYCSSCIYSSLLKENITWFFKEHFLNICISSINLRIERKKRCKHIYLWHKDNWCSPALKAQLWVTYCLVSLCCTVIHGFLPHPQISKLPYREEKGSNPKWTILCFLSSSEQNTDK